MVVAQQVANLTNADYVGALSESRGRLRRAGRSVFFGDYGAQILATII